MAGTLPPLCPLHALTGLDCPGCGGIRFVHAVLHGDLRTAAHDNLFLLLLVPVLAAGWVAVRVARRRGSGVQPARWSGAVLLGLALAWGVVRNLPAWPLQPLIR